MLALPFYAEHFHTVEVDSSFYACPSARTVSVRRNGVPPRRELGAVAGGHVLKVLGHPKGEVVLVEDLRVSLPELLMTKRLEVEPIRQPTLFQMEAAEPARSDRPFCLPGIFLGTSSFTASGWEGSFYPLGMRSKDFLRHYSSQFQTVEIDSTFYGTPAASTSQAGTKGLRRISFSR